LARFLISRLSSLGDVACSLPAAGALKAGFPDCSIAWVVDPRFAGIVRRCKHVDEVVEASPGIFPASWPRFEGEFDAALDLQGLLKSALPISRARSKMKLGYHWQREGSWLFSSRVMPDPSSVHIVDQYVDVARSAGGIADRADFGLEPNEQDLENVKVKLGGIDRFVVMNAGAGWATKRWPAAYFAHVANEIAEKNLQTVLIGGKAESDREAASAVIEASKSRPLDLLGQTSIPELIALLSLCEAHLGGDTGSTHLAAALGKPAVGLYSITRPKRSCPYGQIQRCLYNPAGLSRIPPQDVAETLLEAIS
jgi:heptosyltransferase-1